MGEVFEAFWRRRADYPAGELTLSLYEERPDGGHSGYPSRGQITVGFIPGDPYILFEFLYKNQKTRAP